MVLKKLTILLPGWKFAISAGDNENAIPTGIQTTRSEHFAFLFRRSVVRLVSKIQLPANADKRFVHVPFAANFVSTKQSQLALTFVNVHVSSGDTASRQTEVREIKRLARSIQQQKIADEATHGRNIIVLGDFNLAPREMFDSHHNNSSRGSAMMPLMDAPLATTVFNKLLDNIWMDLARAKELQQSYDIESGVFRFDWNYYPRSHPGFETSRQHTRQLQRRRYAHRSSADAEGSTFPRNRAHDSRMQCTYEVSDYCPVWVAFAARR